MTAVFRLLTLSMALATSAAFASASGIGAMATQLQSQFSAIMLLITGGATLLGVGVFLAGLFKFKAWKENPQQNPLGTAVIFCVVGILLFNLPSFIATGGASLFVDGTSAGIGGVTDLS
jgi:hypothetical protein